jgi:hypothetical protein
VFILIFEIWFWLSRDRDSHFGFSNMCRFGFSVILHVKVMLIYVASYSEIMILLEVNVILVEVNVILVEVSVGSDRLIV